jgi:hypothetical protein
LEHAPVLLAQRFQFHRQRQGVIAVTAEHHHAVMRHQASAAPIQGGDDGVGQRLAAEGGVGGAAHVAAAEARHHVMKGRDALALAGQRGGERRMGVHHGAGLRRAA